jgi:hypothetical protein
MASIAGNSELPSPLFRHAETTVKGTDMGYRNFSPAKIGH